MIVGPAVTIGPADVIGPAVTIGPADVSGPVAVIGPAVAAVSLIIVWSVMTADSAIVSMVSLSALESEVETCTALAGDVVGGVVGGVVVGAAVGGTGLDAEDTTSGRVSAVPGVVTSDEASSPPGGAGAGRPVGLDPLSGEESSGAEVS